MAGSFASALHRAGLISEKRVAETTAQDILNQEEHTRQLNQRAAATRTAERDRRLEILGRTGSVSEFRLEAHKLLLISPEDINRVVQLAHDRDLKEKPKGSWLIANLIQLRNALAQSHGKDEEDIIKRHFSKR